MREKEHNEYNALTKRLLEEGYSAEDHPDYVKVDVPVWQEKTLDNYDGGFIYERRWIFEQTFKTPCGLQCKGLLCHSNMSYMGIEWTFENDMATIRCPYEKKECKLKHEYLQENTVLRYECEVHMTDEEYCYEGSVEHILKLHDDEIRRQKISFGLQRNGRVCQEHMRFNRDTREEWLEWRRHGIGGSDVAAIIGVSPFRTARDTYYDKLGIAAVEEDEWVNGKYGMQLQVEQWREIVPKTREGVLSYLGSGLIKGIGEKTAAEIVARFGTGTLDILENHPERLLEVRGITENRLEDIRTSFAESRMLRDIMTLLAPFKLTPKTALKIYQHFGPACLDLLKKSPFELCQIPGFGFRRVDAIVRKTDNRPRDPMRIRGALHCTLDEAKGKQGHLFLGREELCKTAFKLLNEKIPLPELRVKTEEVERELDAMILSGAVVSMRDNIYHPAAFAQEDETASRIARLLAEERPPMKDISAVIEAVREEQGLRTSGKQESAVRTAFLYNLSVITGSPGTGKTTVLRIILEAYRRLYPDRKIVLMAPTGRASRRMAESTGFDEACTLHSGLGLVSEEDESSHGSKKDGLDADLVIVDEFSMVDMWLASRFFSALKKGAKIVLVGDPDQLPSVGAGNVFKELIQCGLVPVTVLDEIFRQAKDSLIAHNARLIHDGNTKLYYGNDFQFLPCDSQADAAAAIIERYCQEIESNGIEHVQILSPFRTEGAASSDHLNAAIREIVNPFQSAEDEIRIGSKTFRVGDRIMQTRNTGKVSNGDLGFIRYVEDTPEGKRIGLDFGENRSLEYSTEDLVNLDLAYATTIHKAMGSEYDIVLMPVLKAHYIMLYRNLLYTGITRAKKRVVLAGEKSVLFMAIHKNEISKRNTLLGERIRLYYKAYAKSAGIAVPEFLEEELKAAG